MSRKWVGRVPEIGAVLSILAAPLFARKCFGVTEQQGNLILVVGVFVWPVVWVIGEKAVKAMRRPASPD